MSEKVVVIDGNSILNKAFYGLPYYAKKEECNVNGIYGFLNIMFGIVESEQINNLMVVFNADNSTFCHKISQEAEIPAELVVQTEILKEILTKMGICIVQDDNLDRISVISQIIKCAIAEKSEIVLVSGDDNMLQFANEMTCVEIPRIKSSGSVIEKNNLADIEEKYNVHPSELSDVFALMSVGIGEKTAKYLIHKYHSVNTLIDNLDTVTPASVVKIINDNSEQIITKLNELSVVNKPEFELNVDFEKSIFEGIESATNPELIILCNKYGLSQFVSGEEVLFTKIDVADRVQIITDLDKVNDIYSEAEGKEVAFLFCGDKAVALAFGNDIFFIPVSESITLDYLRNKMINLDVKMWIAPNLKENLKQFDIKEKFDIPSEWDKYVAERKKYFDMTVAAYLLNPLMGDYSYEVIAKEYLNLTFASQKDLIGKEDLQTAVETNATSVAKCAGLSVYTALNSYQILLKELKKTEMYSLFVDMEMPLVFVLSDMEKEGICIDGAALKEYGNKLSVSLSELEERIYLQACEEFNINSPKQLGVILFEKLGLPNGKKTKTGYSTSAEVLEKLAGEYPIVDDVLEYRQLSKLKSTYADGLTNYINEDGKIHTTFNQTITATGRLSSTEPNLQNIPIRIELGKLIRKVFHPENGNIFIDSDYSQIELRVLAAMSGDKVLIDAFKNGQDIHRTTAAKVFNVPFEAVTELQRRNAKAVNFGIVYGISAFGLSQDLNISKKEAQAFIDSYFEAYPEIKNFLDLTIDEAKKNGYIRTLFGRVRPIPELSSNNFMQKQFGERVAMNSPIQGTAADIIKIAMIKVHDRLISEGHTARLILQVHDELLIEAPENEKELIINILEEEMKNAVELIVSMEVEIEVGADWYEAH